MKVVNPFKVFVTPEYMFRPRQILTRLFRMFEKERPECTTVELPWGHSIAVRPREVIGAQIYYYGIFDLLISEVIWRLLDPGDTTADVGANLGQMTSLMYERVGSSGKIFAWEPHPGLYAELEANMAGKSGFNGNVLLRKAALSSKPGRMSLEVSANWDRNRGTARLCESPADGGSAIEVEVETLIEALGADTHLALLKIDVEGFERQVLEGAGPLFAKGLIRDIVFEDIRRGESGVAAWLKQRGMSLFGIEGGFFGPRLNCHTDSKGLPVAVRGDNYLATLDPARVIARLSARGWCVLSAKVRS